jgi:hypothetical protein
MKIFILIIVLISILNMKTTFSRGGGDGEGGRDGWPRKSWYAWVSRRRVEIIYTRSGV